jgi:endo-1,4-beta-mannosidase
MAEAIKSVDPEMLVSEGVFTPRIVGKDYNGDSFGVRVGKNTDMRFPPQASVIAGGAIDFVDIHIYYVKKDFDLAESYRLDMISIGLYDPKMKIILPQKPFVLGEFGAFKFIANTAAQARQDMLQTRDLALKDRAQGYLLWTFDTTEQKCLWNATGLGDDFIRDLGAMDSIVK